MRLRGGIDASILEDHGVPLENDELLMVGTRFQIKSGKFAAWQPAELQKELFARKPVAAENLKPAIRRALEEGRRFVLACTGVDPTDQDVRKAVQGIKALLRKCGFANAVIEVWGQTSLIGLLQSYPSLCLRLQGKDAQNFRSRASWKSDDDMQAVTHFSPELVDLMDELREQLRSGEIGHLRLVGEPGVGKTRFALELTSPANMAPAVLYVRDGQSLLKSSFIHDLLQTDNNRFVILVVDECPDKDRAEIWNVLKSRGDRVRLITIDHGPDSSADDRMRVESIKPLGEEEIIAILADHGLSATDARRWTEYCEGCPRVAHVLGENLRLDRSDLLQEPATVEMWRRFIIGYDAPDSEEVELRHIVLQVVSIFERFGFEMPVEEEARFIAGIAERFDPRITLARFRALVQSLKKRRILQGTTTLYITPRLLQVYLYRKFWETYGSAFPIGDLLGGMPDSLRRWFVRMLRYAHDVKAAERAIDRFLAGDETFPEGEFADDDVNGRLIEALAEACPASTLRCLERTIGTMEIGSLREVKRARQALVWALGKIAVREEHFVGAAMLLLRLAEAENAKHANNATESFCELFSLIPGMAATQAPPSVRLGLLKETLESDIPERRALGVQACKTALYNSLSFRSVWSEHQGLQKTFQFWVPQTYGELFDAHRDVWELLTGRLASWSGEERRMLITAIIKAAWSTLHVGPLAEMVVATLKAIGSDPMTDVKELVTLLKREFRNENSKLPGGVQRDLRELCDSLDGRDFSSKLLRFVKYSTWDDNHDDKWNLTNTIERKLDELADAAIHDRGLLTAELPWLVCEESSQAYGFAWRLGDRDRARILLPAILAQQASQPGAGASFLSGYLGGIFRQDSMEWESVVRQLAVNPATASRYSDYVIASGMSDAIAMSVVEHCRSGAQSVERLERWWFDQQLESLSLGVLQELLKLQLEQGSGKLWSNAVHMAHTYFIGRDGAKALPEQLILDLLTSEAMADGRITGPAGYYWSRLAEAYLKQYPQRQWELFRKVLRSGAREWSVLVDLNTQEEHLLTRLLQENPSVAFECIADAYRECPRREAYALQHWLSEDGHRLIGNESPGPIQFIPPQTLFSWVDENVDDHGYWLAGTLPKTLDKSIAGRLTRDFLAKYGADRTIASALYCRFSSRGWCGNASDHYRKLREDARLWLEGERDINVIRWIGKYIEALTSDIERSEIDEERGR